MKKLLVLIALSFSVLSSCSIHKNYKMEKGNYQGCVDDSIC